MPNAVLINGSKGDENAITTLFGGNFGILLRKMKMIS